LDIHYIELPDKAYDVVLSGAVLVHVKEWKEAVRELARITGSYLILHRTPITDAKSYRIEKRISAGVPTFYNKFNKDD
jgi:ubiquinone/menaquinone biosynthesis C-methylase UbiE